MQDFLEWVSGYSGLSVEIEMRILATLASLLFLLLVRRIVLIFVKRNNADVAVLYYWRKATSYVVFAISVFLVAAIWLRGFQSFSTYLGLLSAGLAIALKDPLVNLAGWIFIIWRRPFNVGQRIQIGDLRGDVIDQRIFMFSVLEIGNWVDAEQSTGRVVHVPNGKIFTEPVANYEEGFTYIWHEIGVMVTFESNWEKAKKILTTIAENRGESMTKEAEREIKLEAGKMLIYLSALTPIVYTSVADSGVVLTIRYLCNPRRRRGTEEAIWEDILREFGACDDIDFAYPTQRHYLNHYEGKSGAKSDLPGVFVEREE